MLAVLEVLVVLVVLEVQRAHDLVVGAVEVAVPLHTQVKWMSPSEVVQAVMDIALLQEAQPEEVLVQALVVVMEVLEAHQAMQVLMEVQDAS